MWLISHIRVNFSKDSIGIRSHERTYCAIRIQLRDVFEIYFSALDQIKDMEPCSRAPRKVTVAL